MQRMANRARRDLEFSVDDLAWLSTKHLPLRAGTRKLAALFAGPFRVTKIVSPVAFKLALPAEWRIHDVFHVSQLKAVHGKID
jgi:hypothetical protein